MYYYNQREELPARFVIIERQARHLLRIISSLWELCEAQILNHLPIHRTIMDLNFIAEFAQTLVHHGARIGMAKFLSIHVRYHQISIFRLYDALL